jgi:adenosylmethionine-8-amino-7-oxononanoate aminotransferase
MLSSDYALWHGIRPMGPFLRNVLSRDKLLVEGRGIRVRDSGGKWYLDARSSLWNMSLGYDHPKVLAAVHAQLDRLPFATLLSYEHPPAVSVDFANALAARLPAELGHIRLGSTGSQMTEAAMLLSRFCRQATGEPERSVVIGFDGSYHGTGPGATVLSGYLRKAHAWCGPILPGVVHVPADGDWSQSLRARVAEIGPDRVTAVILEPLMGSAGIIPRPDELVAVGSYCRDSGIHLIADEVTTGYGRVGHMSRMLQLGVLPDLLVLSKGIAAGYAPAAALAVHHDIFSALSDLSSGQAFVHGSTTDGHPLAAAAGLAVLDVLYGDGLLATVAGTGDVLQDTLARVHREYLPAGEVSGVGLMRRFRLCDRQERPWPAAEIDRLHEACEDAGLLVSISTGCMWFLPPLITTGHECEQIAERFADALGALRKAGCDLLL